MQVTWVAVVVRDAPLAIMQIVGNDGKGIDREVTDEVINDEITRAGLQAQSWVRINPADVPADRSKRDQWRLDGNKVVAG